MSSALTAEYLDLLETSRRDIIKAIQDKGASPHTGFAYFASDIGEIYTPTVQDQKEVYIQENGDHIISPDDGYEVMKSVNVRSRVEPDLQDKAITIEKNSVQTVTPDSGYDGLSSVEVTVDVDLQYKSITINENGTQSVIPSDGYDGLSEVEINVDVPTPTFETQEKSIVVTKNGTQTVTPDSGYDGLSSVAVTVNVASSGGSDKMQIPNGFRFTGGDLALVDFSQYDWSMVYDTSDFFSGCTHTTGDWTNFNENFNGEVLTGYRMFYNYKGSVIPLIDTAKVKNMEEMFRFCSNINTIPLIDTSSASIMERMFQNCTYLTTIPLIDTSNVVNMRYMFSTCTHLTTIPLIDTSNVTDMFYMFSTCTSLESIPQLNTQNVTNMESMFDTCTYLTTIPLIDTSNVTNMYRMFYSCRALTSLPQINTSKVTNFAQMFRGCTSLTSAPELDYSSITGGMNNDASGVAYMFTSSGVKSIPDVNSKKVAAFGGYYSWVSSATNLQSIGVVDCDSVTSVSGLLGNTLTGLSNLTNLGGFRNLGKASSVADTNGQYFLNNAPNLTYESVMNVINLLYDRAAAGLSVLTLKLHPKHLAMLSEDDIAIATNKGWTLV